MAITTGDVRRLREITGAGVMECKRALTEADGDLERAQAILRTQGAVIAEKKAGREASQGVIEAYVHTQRERPVGVLVEVNCETDFVARSDDFKQLARDLALQIAAMDPKRIGNEDGAAGDGDDVEPSQILLEQEFIRDPSQSVQDRINDTVSRVRERIVVRRFTRFELGA
jgi:elongation factor Ts